MDKLSKRMMRKGFKRGLASDKDTPATQHLNNSNAANALMSDTAPEEFKAYWRGYTWGVDGLRSQD
jgi:hypothetical protein